MTGFWSIKPDSTWCLRELKSVWLRLLINALQDGQLVYVCDHGVRGYNKIHDLWNSVLHKVLRDHKPGGVVYTIAPVDALDKMKRVYRTMLKSYLGTEPAASPSSPAQTRVGLQADNSSDELCVLVPAGPSSNMAVCATVPLTTMGCSPSPPLLCAPTTQVFFGQGGEEQEVTTLTSLSKEVRRTARPTSGQHAYCMRGSRIS